MKITDLKPLEKNPFKSKGDKQIEAISKSIKDFSEMMSLRPIIVDEDMTILGGNKRYFALKMLGYKEIPDNWVKMATDLTEAQKKEFVVKDNAHWGSEWDFDMLKDWDVDLADFGVEVDFNSDDLLTEDDVQEVEADDPDNVKTEIQEGDLFQIGRHKLICGDATDYSIYDKNINENINLVFTSPPYNMAGDMYEGYNDNYKSEEYIKFNLKVASNCIKKLNGFLFWNISYNKNARFEFIKIANEFLNINKLQFMELIVWNKKTAMPVVSKKLLTRQYEDIFVLGTEKEIDERFDLYYLGNTNEKRYFNKHNKKALRNYWEITTGGSQLDNHKACFPIKLPARAINLCCLKEDSVLDPFAGSGTTMLACEQLGMKNYSIELLPNYCQVIINRMRKINPDIEIKCLNRDFNPLTIDRS